MINPMILSKKYFIILSENNTKVKNFILIKSGYSKNYL